MVRIILQRELTLGNISRPALFLGDSKYDYIAAQSAQLDFVFLSGWSEVSDWKEWTNSLSIDVVDSVGELAALK